jgi:cellulose synthase/poly-beta-1,6-N-acetylglucosamine synthase-like glycosyltransferase
MPWFSPAAPSTQLLLLLIPCIPIALVALVHLLALPLAVCFEVGAAIRRHRGDPTLWDEWPSVSVVVSAHNASGVIGDCVRSIGLTRYSRYEIILIDEGSTDNTGDMIASLAAADPRIKELRQARPGRAAARNLGLRAATGDVVMFVDADLTFSRCTVDHMLQAFEGPRAGAVVGAARPARWNQGGLLAAVNHLGISVTRRALTAVGGLPFLPGGIAAFPRRVLAELGPIPEAAAEGAESVLLWRVQAAGYRVSFAPSARVHTASPSTLRDLWRIRSHRARGLLRSAAAGRDLMGRRCVGRRALASARAGGDRDDDAWRALREAWA